MPFKSEAQRRYLWANEPEIARDWTDTYGSKIHAADGGIMNTQRRRYFSGAYGQGAGDRGGNPHASRAQNVASGHVGGQGNRGPINVHADTTPVVQQQRRADFLNEVRRQQAEQAPDVFGQSWTGPKGLFSGGYRDLKTPGVTAGGHKSRFNPMGILAGLISKPLGWATSGINTLRNQFNKYGTKMGDWRENLTGYRTQKEYNEARAERQLRNRIERLRKTRDIGRYSDDPEGWDQSDLSSRLSDFENQLGITGIASGINYPGGEPVAQISDTPRISIHDFEGVDFDNIAMQNYLQDQSNFTPGGIMDIDTETTEELLPEYDPFAGDAEETLLEKAKRINEEVNKPLSAKLATHPATGESVHDKFPGRSLEWLYGLPNNYGTPQTFIRDYDKRNEPYPFINYHPDDEEIAIMRGYR